jgi:CHAT domain-containing protein/tetratricopeptide (TPR) repeat protein
LLRPLDRHLDGDELDALVSLQAVGVADGGCLSEDALREAQHHVESCRDCDRKLQMHRSVQSEISQQPTSGNAAKGPNCLDEKTWVNVAAGLVSEADARERLKHAAQCGHCGPLLKAASRSLSDEATTDEEALLADLGSARPDWQAQMAQALRHAGEARKAAERAPSFWKGPFYWPRPAFAAAAFAVLVAAVWIGVRTLRPPSAENLLAKAYSERRTMEVRIPGAKYAPMRVERSDLGSSFDKPQSLLKAEALISEGLEKQPNNPAWLEAKARAEMLDGTYDDAIKTLQRGLESRPDSPDLLTDLGSAYYLRAKSADRPIDYSNAIDALGKALAKRPDNTIALFNRALACEQMFLYTQSVDDWEQYLRLDPQGDWANEARRRLASIKEKVNQHNQSMAEPLLSPTQIAGFENNPVVLKMKIDIRVEEYVHAAITEWLPQAFPLSGVASKESLSALSTLASILVEEHDDPWLSDLLTQAKGKQFSSGIYNLAVALKADDRGDYSEAHITSQRAATLLRAAGNSAGELRARAEEVYSDHLLWEGKACIALLRTLAAPLRANRYGWLRAQMSLERSNCSNQVGDMEVYRSAIEAGMREAQAHKYVPLYVRGLGFEALDLGTLGDVPKSFSLAQQGLALFWSRDVDLTKGYNLYYNLDAIADGHGLPNFQLAVLREATVLLDGGPNIVKRAMAHSWYGKAAYLSNNADLAAAELSKASLLFAASPPTAATARDHLDAEVWLANAEVSLGDFDRAAERLHAIEPILYNAPSFDPEIEFYTAKANLALRSADTVGAEATLRSALFLAEWGLDTFHDSENRRQWAEQTRDAYRDVVEWKLRQGDFTSALELWEWYKGGEMRVARSGQTSALEHAVNAPPDPRDAPPLPSPSVVTNSLPILRDQTIVAYGTFYDRTAIWTYDDRGIFLRWVEAPPARVKGLAVKLRRLCSDPSSNLDELRSTAHSLYDLLLQPVEQRLDQDRTLVLEPDGYLLTIPWEVLVDSGGHYLAERFATITTPGLYWQVHHRSTVAITPSSPALIVSVTTAPAEGVVPLSDADNEGRVVAEEFTSSRWLRNETATIAAIRQEMSSKEVFHFVGHAEASPQRSGLVLAEVDPAVNRSRLLTAEDLTQTEINNLQLAVLSACPSDSEVEAKGLAGEGLTASFLNAGVPRVVASRWNVDSSETSHFMMHFYRQLLGSRRVAESIRSARLATASVLATAHPYYWSAFELEGTN